MKKILILTDSFPPGFAPRMGYLSTYLKKMGWDAYAIAPATTDLSKCHFDHLVGFIPSTIVENYSTVSVSMQHRAYRLLNRILKRRWSWSLLDERMYLAAKEVIIIDKYDAVLCSTADFLPIEVALRIAREFNLPLILDFRDICEQSIKSFQSNTVDSLVANLYRKRRNHILRQADAIISVSPWHKKFLSKYNSRSYLIYNGYDSRLFYPRALRKTEKMKLVYTGTIMPFNDIRTRNPTPLFEAIAKLSADNKIDYNTFCIEFYTDETSRQHLDILIKKFRITQYVVLKEWVSSSAIPDILASANLLLVLAANQGTNGIMTTKIFEYLAVGRLILCIPNDHNGINELLEKSNAGNSLDTVSEISEYIHNKYQEWYKDRILLCSTDFSYIEQFTRESQAAQFVSIFESITSKKI